MTTIVVVPINLVHKSNVIIAFILIINENLFRISIWFSDMLITEAFYNKTYPFRPYFRFTDVQSFMMYFREYLAQLIHFTNEETKTHRS